MSTEMNMGAWKRSLCILIAGLTMFAVDAAPVDYRFYFTGDADGTLVAQPTMAYLFAVSDLAVAENYTQIISRSEVGTLDAFAVGSVDRWGSHPFFDFNPDEEVWNKVFLWAVVNDGGYQTGWSSDMYKDYIGPLQPANTIGYEKDPMTDEAKGFVAMWTDDAIALSPFSSIPEPSSGLLMLFGLGLLGLRRSRK